MMNLYHDTESGEIVHEAELRKEFAELQVEQPEEYSYTLLRILNAVLQFVTNVEILWHIVHGGVSRLIRKRQKKQKMKLFLLEILDIMEHGRKIKGIKLIGSVNK